ICLDLVSDYKESLWIATDQGLSKMDFGEQTKIERINFESAPLTNTTFFVEFSDNTSLWTGTERGLHRLDIITGITKYYGYDDGFYPLETNQRAVCRGKSNDLWIGTVDGLVHYLPKYDEMDLQAPHLIIHQPKINGESYIEVPDNPDEAPLIPFKNNTIEFSFTGIHTTIPEKNRFSYMLEGLDDNWSVPGKERIATYERIPSGDYVLRVKAYNLDGVETTEDASYAFTIKTPFWKTPWFIILLVIAVLVLFYLYLKYRERQLIRDKRNLEKNVKERTREIEDAKVEIETQRDQIVEQTKGITDSIQYASHIQHAVLPGKLTLQKYLPEHFILFKPRDIVSGDFYWVEQKNDRLIICAADCTGHGVPGAFMSMLGLTFLNEIVNKDEILKASEILDRLRSYIINAMSHKDSQGMDGMDISLVVLDRGLNTMEYAGAYNPLILVRQGEVLEYKADKMPVGKHVVEVGPFTNQRIPLEKGDVFYLFSDGFPDQFGGEKGGKYKTRPFRLLLQRISKKPMEEQHRILENELNDWMKDVEQVDDILVMGIRYD
ncbi:MAG: SpoIIE family protein phosphatase, partial [Bacteroides sp.]|nr:SpoIIE family protein phosphatase [Bacteroides sp.]